ncbi:MAG: response regulator [Pseudobacteriovorax sp.]|nr:response regulator [Pseudobacteriovorax sp.]
MISVVCIDDNSIDLKIHSRVIERSGVGQLVRAFTLATEALEWFRSENQPAVDLILLDINMPMMNGFEFLEEFMKLDLTKTLVVCLVSTSENPKDLERAETLGAKFNSKPLTKSGFIELVDSLFGSGKKI